MIAPPTIRIPPVRPQQGNLARRLSGGVGTCSACSRPLSGKRKWHPASVRGSKTTFLRNPMRRRSGLRPGHGGPAVRTGSATGRTECAPRERDCRHPPERHRYLPAHGGASRRRPPPGNVTRPRRALTALLSDRLLSFTKPCLLNTGRRSGNARHSERSNLPFAPIAGLPNGTQDITARFPAFFRQVKICKAGMRAPGPRIDPASRCGMQVSGPCRLHCADSPSRDGGAGSSRPRS